MKHSNRVWLSYQEGWKIALLQLEKIEKSQGSWTKLRKEKTSNQIIVATAKY